MSQLKGGNVIGIRVGDQEFRNEDGAPITFLVENQDGEILELYLTVGRMGTYPMLTRPPLRLGVDDPAYDLVPTAPVTPSVQQAGTRSAVRVGSGQGRAVIP
jgi:hypothetical protein